MSSDWDEIKRLAADFLKAQLTSTLQKLSERNCVEVVSLLLQKEFVDVIFTNDGKEYITPDHLEKEILDEIYMSGGRINLVQISKSLNVDFTKIDHIASKIASENEKIKLMLGQLIEESYIMHISQEINGKLAQRGQINVSDLTIQYDLPSDFLQNLMEKHLGNIIRGRQDTCNSREFFTQAYFQRCKSKIKGILAAVTKPTTVASIHQQISVPEKMIHSLIDEVTPAGSITAKLSTAHYVPHIYAKMQIDWVTSFYKENGFLEYDAISKLGIADSKLFIKKHFQDEDMLYLKKCVVGSKVIDLTLISALEECNVTKSFVDLSTIMPSNMSDEDIEELFYTILPLRNIPNNFIYLENIVFSNKFLEIILEPCNNLAIAKAKAAVESGLYQQYLAEKQLVSSKETNNDLKTDKREERRKKASLGKVFSGAGNQGRETKTKSTKKLKCYGKNKGGNADSDSDADNGSHRNSNKSLELVNRSEIEKIISKVLEEEGIENLSGAITAFCHNEINEKAMLEAQTIFQATPQTTRRQTHASLQEKINTLMVYIRLYEKGLKVFPVDVQSQMLKYLMKTLGNDICTELTIYVANECNLNLKLSSNLNIDQRNKIAQACDPEYKTKLIEINKALNKTFDEFILATQEVLKACSMVVKKVDKKKDRLLIVQHKTKLFQQLYETDDHAIVLHLTSLIIFITVTGFILHASGRFVSQILAVIRPFMSSEQNNLLMRYHDLVLKMMQLDIESNEYKTVNQDLTSIQADIKALGKSYEKPGVTKAD